MKVMAILLAVALVGCTTMNPAAEKPVSSLSDDELCSFYNHKHFGILVGRDAIKKKHPEVVAELMRRDLINDWEMVRAGKVRVGMSRCAVLASWGYPTKVNRASYGDQWVYCRDGAYCIQSQYVYFRSGQVSGWN